MFTGKSSHSTDGDMQIMTMTTRWQSTQIYIIEKRAARRKWLTAWGRRRGPFTTTG